VGKCQIDQDVIGRVRVETGARRQIIAQLRSDRRTQRFGSDATLGDAAGAKYRFLGLRPDNDRTTGSERSLRPSSAIST
jgi:hypothetical protein